MHSRSMAILSSLLTALGSVSSVASILAHAGKHVEAAETGVGHVHGDGQMPHHEHESDGDPIPATSHPTFCGPRPASGTAQFALVMPAPISSVIQPEFTFACHCTPSLRHFLMCLPRVPAPGDVLPLLI